MVEGERALEGRRLLGFFPAGDDGRERLANENALCEISFRQTCRKHIFLKSDVVTEFDHSQVIVRATCQVVRVDDNVFHVQNLLFLLWAGAALACGSKTRRWGRWCFSTACTHKGTGGTAVICLDFGLFEEVSLNYERLLKTCSPIFFLIFKKKNDHLRK